MKILHNLVTKNKIIAYVVLSVLMVVGVVIGYSSAFFVSTLDVNNNVVSTECFILMLEDRHDINLEKAYPMSEEEGSKLIPYEFTITNVCNAIEDYQVNIETIDSSTMDNKYVRYKLDNAPSKKISEQEEVETYVNDGISDSRKIATGTLRNNESITYNLRIWVDEETTTEQAADKIYRSKVVVLSEPKQEITMHANGGTVEINPVRKTIGKAIGELEVPRRAGYDFEDWYVNEELTKKVNRESVMTTKLTDLYAKWQARNDTRYIVEHYQMDTEGNYPETPYESEELYGTTDTKVTPARRTYEHFQTPEGQEVNIDGDGSQVVKYYYERNKYTQTTEGRYMNTSGEYGSYSTLEKKDVYYGATYSYSVAQDAEYYGVSVEGYEVTEPKTNQVSFERRQYTQTTQGRYMDTSGSYGSYSTLETKNVYYGANYSYSKAATTEYAAASVASYTVTAAKTNKISFARNKYTVTYNANGGSVSPTSASVYYNATTKLPTPTKTGYTAKGWYSATSGGTKFGNAGATYTVTAAKTMNAQWTANTFTVAYDGNGYTGGSRASHTCTYDASCTLAANGFTKTGHTFAGWKKGNSGSTLAAGTSIKNAATSGTVTYYAQWNVNSYTLTYNANGGSVSPTSKSVNYGAGYGTLPTPSRSYYKFDGWYTASSGGSSVNANTTMGAGDTTIYAHWSSKWKHSGGWPTTQECMRYCPQRCENTWSCVSSTSTPPSEEHLLDGNQCWVDQNWWD